MTMLPPVFSQDRTLPVHVAYEIKAERIKFSNDSVKLTWKMKTGFTGEFVAGRSEKDFVTSDDVLQAKLIGVFYPGQEGLLIDRELQQGKNYYYIVISRDHLLKREIDIIKDVNCTAAPVFMYSEPDGVKSIKAGPGKENTINIEWDNPRGSDLKFNLYRSRSVINSKGELEVAEKLITTDDDEYIDKNVTEYGSYYYAVTVMDKNGIEYFNPAPDKNFTANGIYLKGKTFSSPLNVGAYAGEKDSIIVKWEKAKSRTDRALSGYEIYRSEEMINSLLKLKFARLLLITDAETILYTDKEPGPGKYYYAVFARYSDGAVDINFDEDTNYTKTPVIITLPYNVTALSPEAEENKIILRWNHSGNSGPENVGIFRTKYVPENALKIMKDDIIGTENIKSGRFVISYPEEGTFYYGVIIKNREKPEEIKPGVNITSFPIIVKKSDKGGADIIQIRKDKKTKKRKTVIEDKAEIIPDTPADRDLDYIIRNQFYKAQYLEASKELKNYIKNADNEKDRSRARLYLARTYIELADYRSGITILNSKDVKKYFPSEAKFWNEFATVRLK